MHSEAFSKVVSQLGLYNYEGSQWRTGCPVHQQENDLYREGFGLDFEQAPDGRVHFTCRKGCAPLAIGRAFGLAPAQIVLDAAPAPAARLALPHEIFNGPADPPPAPPARPAAPEPPSDHFYYDANRVLVAVKRRIRNADGSKRFVWFTAAGYKTGRAGLDGLAMSDLPLYRLPELRAAEGKRVVWVVEGERKCDVLLAHGLTAVTVAGGAGHRDLSQLADELEGRLVALWPDNDEPGQAFMQRVAAALRDRANSCRWVLPPGLPPKGDAADFFAAGRTVAELWDVYTQAPEAPGKDDHPGAEATHPLYHESLRADDHLRSALPTPEPVEVRLDEVTPTTVRWLWPGRIPLGKITVLDGDPGLGKSLLTLDLAARVSRGDVMPDGVASDLSGAAGVLLLSAEDSVSDTIRPRLDAAGANPARVVALPYVQEGEALRLPTLADTAALEKTIARQDARLVIVDPLMAYLGAEVHAHRDQDVRRILAPLAALAEQSGAAILVVRHLNKSGQGSALYRGGGSIGIIGAARAGLLVAKDPDDPTGERRIVVGTKANLAAPQPALAYHVSTDANGAAHLVWDGPTTHTAAALLAAPASAEESSALAEAKDFLRGFLGEDPQTAEVIHSAAESAGITRPTLLRAKAALKVKAEKHGFGKGAQWVWVLPAPSREDDHPAKDDHPTEHEYLRPADDHLRAMAPFCLVCGGPCTGRCDRIPGLRFGEPRPPLRSQP